MCERGSALLDFERPCCCARFLASLPSKEMRVMWLARWRAQAGSAMAEAIKAALKALHDRRVAAEAERG